MRKLNWSLMAKKTLLFVLKTPIVVATFCAMIYYGIRYAWITGQAPNKSVVLDGAMRFHIWLNAPLAAQVYTPNEPPEAPNGQHGQ